MKHLIAALTLLSSVGCASHPSTYTDLSTPDQRNIQATGQAATEAARSNQSINADIEVRGGSNLTTSTGNGQYDRRLYNADGTRNRAAERALFQSNSYQRSRGNRSYTDYTRQRASSKFDNRMKRAINEELDRFFDKVF